MHHLSNPLDYWSNGHLKAKSPAVHPNFSIKQQNLESKIYLCAGRWRAGRRERAGRPRRADQQQPTVWGGRGGAPEGGGASEGRTGKRRRPRSPWRTLERSIRHACVTYSGSSVNELGKGEGIGLDGLPVGLMGCD